MIDSLDPNSATSLARDRAQETLDDALYEIERELTSYQEEFDLLYGIESWIERRWGYTCIDEVRYARVLEAERRMRVARPIVKALDETLQSAYGRVRVSPPSQQGDTPKHTQE